MTIGESYVLQHTPDPFEGKWEDLAIFTWRGKKWELALLQDRPVNITLNKWCAEEVLPAAAHAFLDQAVERLGKLKYRFVSAAEYQG